jgi:predicted AAA+ superfamily ATPase
MERTYIRREIEGSCLTAAKEFPLLLVTGPRQTGKSTLLTQLFPKHAYVTFDLPTTRNLALRDPELFLENLGPRAILDEIQYVPQLLPYLKVSVDRDRGQNGRYLMTGSQMFSLMAGVSESLAGRVAIFELLGFSIAENPPKGAGVKDCFERIFSGGYPEPALGRTSPSRFYGSYLATYLERDIRQIRSVQDLGRFQDFLELLAARAASILNVNELARDCGVNHQTARNWLSLLESTRLIYLLRPYAKNITKRVVKSPKLYFTDTGLLAHLLRYPDPATMASGPMAGVFFENWVVSEALKHKLNHCINGELYFYRDSNGNEIDLILDLGRVRHLVEVKVGKTLRSEALDAFRRTASVVGGSRLFWVSMSDQAGEVERGVQALPWDRLGDLWILSSEKGMADGAPVVGESRAPYRAGRKTTAKGKRSGKVRVKVGRASVTKR